MRVKTLADAKKACKGFEYASLECPTAAGAEAWCLNKIGNSRLLADHECYGTLTDTKDGLPGSPAHCVGPYDIGGAIGGGRNRAAIYRIAPKPNSPGNPDMPPILPPIPLEQTPNSVFWKNLVAAKAFSMLAKDRIVDIAESHVNFLSSAKLFFLGFAKDGFTKDEDIMFKAITKRGAGAPMVDLRDQYKRLMVSLWNDNKHVWGDGSLGPYILKSLDAALRTKDGILVTKPVLGREREGNFVMPTAESFGMGSGMSSGELDEDAMYHIAVPLFKYEALYQKLMSMSWQKGSMERETLIRIYKKVDPSGHVPADPAMERKEKGLIKAPAVKKPPKPAVGSKISIVVHMRTGAMAGSASKTGAKITFYTSNGAMFGPYEFNQALPPKGMGDLYSFCTDETAAKVVKFGNINKVRLESMGNDDYYFSMLKVRVAGAAEPWVNFAAGRWLDGSVSKSTKDRKPVWELSPAPDTPPPTKQPTAMPTGAPTATPTLMPTGAPTATPTGVPTNSPTPPPTYAWNVAMKLTASAGNAGAKVHVKLIGSKGSSSFSFSSSASGSDTVKHGIDNIGKIMSVKLSSKFYKLKTLKLRLNSNGGWQVFGPGHATVKGTLDLHHEDKTLMVKVATGKPVHPKKEIHHNPPTQAQSAKLLIKGSKGFKLLQMPTGKAGQYHTFKAKSVELGKLLSVKLIAMETNPWFFTDVKVGTGKASPVTYVNFGPAPGLLTNSKTGQQQAKDLHIEGVAHASSFTLTPHHHTIKIKVGTGTRPRARTWSYPKITITGSKGTHTGVFRPPTIPGEVAELSMRSDDIGLPTNVTLTSSSQDSWFFSQLWVKSGVMGEWVGFGADHQWLVSKPYPEDETQFGGRGYGETLHLTPRSFKTYITVTTGFAYKAESSAPVMMVLKGETADSSVFALKDLPAQGKTKKFEFNTIGLGAIKAVQLSATSTDGWMFSKFMIQQGENAKLHMFGPEHQWIVKGPITSKACSYLPYAEHVLLTPATRHFFVKFATSIIQNHTSTDIPRLTFIGTLANNTFNLPDKTPAPNTVSEYDFWLTDIGKFVALELRAQNSDPWLVDGIQYKEAYTPFDGGKYDATSFRTADQYQYADYDAMLNAPEPIVIQNKELAKQAAAAGSGSGAGSAMSMDINLMDDDDDELEFTGLDSPVEKAWNIQTLSKLPPSALDTMDPGEVTGSLAKAIQQGQWQTLGSREWLSGKDKHTGEYPKMNKEDNKFMLSNKQIARPEGTGCHPSGMTIRVPRENTKYNQDRVGGYCAKHLADDAKPWAYVLPTCAGHHKSHMGSAFEWAYCKDPLVPVAVYIHTPMDANTKGQFKVKIQGDRGPTHRYKLKKGLLKRGKWAKFDFRVPENTKQIRNVIIKSIGGHGKMCFDHLRAQYGGGFIKAFGEKNQGKKVCVGTKKFKKLVHVQPMPAGKAKVKVEAYDAQNVAPLEASYFLLTPSLLGMSDKMLRMKLKKYRKKLVADTEAHAEMSKADKDRAVMRFVSSLGGFQGDNPAFRPVGLDYLPNCKSNCIFRNVEAGQDHLVLMYAAGHLLGIDRASTKGYPKMAVTKSYLAKNMKHGQMLVTLAWGEYPSDLDLYVVAPAKHGVIQVGGDKAAISAKLDALAKKDGATINWMDKGSPTEFPYVVLDVDATMGYGPETVTVHKPIVGTYKIYVDCYSCYGEDSFKQFKNSGASVKVFDRFGLRKEFLIKDVVGKPQKYWGVAHRRCWPPAPLDGAVKKGFANRDNKWDFKTVPAFYNHAPSGKTADWRL
jgi:hypothetical protein